MADDDFKYVKCNCLKEKKKEYLESLKSRLQTQSPPQTPPTLPKLSFKDFVDKINNKDFFITENKLKWLDGNDSLINTLFNFCVTRSGEIGHFKFALLLSKCGFKHDAIKIYNQNILASDAGYHLFIERYICNGWKKLVEVVQEKLKPFVPMNGKYDIFKLYHNLGGYANNVTEEHIDIIIKMIEVSQVYIAAAGAGVAPSAPAVAVAVAAGAGDAPAAPADDSSADDDDAAAAAAAEKDATINDCAHARNQIFDDYDHTTILIAGLHIFKPRDALTILHTAAKDITNNVISQLFREDYQRRVVNNLTDLGCMRLKKSEIELNIKIVNILFSKQPVTLTLSQVIPLSSLEPMTQVQDTVLNGVVDKLEREMTLSTIQSKESVKEAKINIIYLNDDCKTYSTEEKKVNELDNLVEGKYLDSFQIFVTQDSLKRDMRPILRLCNITPSAVGKTSTDCLWKNINANNKDNLSQTITTMCNKTGKDNYDIYENQPEKRFLVDFQLEHDNAKYHDTQSPFYKTLADENLENKILYLKYLYETWVHKICKNNPEIYKLLVEKSPTDIIIYHFLHYGIKLDNYSEHLKKYMRYSHENYNNIFNASVSVSINTNQIRITSTDERFKTGFEMDFLEGQLNLQGQEKRVYNKEMTNSFEIADNKGDLSADVSDSIINLFPDFNLKNSLSLTELNSVNTISSRQIDKIYDILVKHKELKEKENIVENASKQNILSKILNPTKLLTSNTQLLRKKKECMEELPLLINELDKLVNALTELDTDTSLGNINKTMYLKANSFVHDGVQYGIKKEFKIKNNGGEEVVTKNLYFKPKLIYYMDRSLLSSVYNEKADANSEPKTYKLQEIQSMFDLKIDHPLSPDVYGEVYILCNKFKKIQITFKIAYQVLGDGCDTDMKETTIPASSIELSQLKGESTDCMIIEQIKKNIQEEVIKEARDKCLYGQVGNLNITNPTIDFNNVTNAPEWTQKNDLAINNFESELIKIFSDSHFNDTVLNLEVKFNYRFNFIKDTKRKWEFTVGSTLVRTQEYDFKCQQQIPINFSFEKTARDDYVMECEYELTMSGIVSSSKKTINIILTNNNDFYNLLESNTGNILKIHNWSTENGDEKYNDLLPLVQKSHQKCIISLDSTTNSTKIETETLFQELERKKCNFQADFDENNIKIKNGNSGDTNFEKDADSLFNVKSIQNKKFSFRIFLINEIKNDNGDKKIIISSTDSKPSIKFLKPQDGHTLEKMGIQEIFYEGRLVPETICRTYLESTPFVSSGALATMDTNKRLFLEQLNSESSVKGEEEGKVKTERNIIPSKVIKTYVSHQNTAIINLSFTFERRATLPSKSSEYNSLIIMVDNKDEVLENVPFHIMNIPNPDICYSPFFANEKKKFGYFITFSDVKEISLIVLDDAYIRKISVSQTWSSNLICTESLNYLNNPLDYRSQSAPPITFCPKYITSTWKLITYYCEQNKPDGCTEESSTHKEELRLNEHTMSIRGQQQQLLFDLDHKDDERGYFINPTICAMDDLKNKKLESTLYFDSNYDLYILGSKITSYTAGIQRTSNFILKSNIGKATKGYLSKAVNYVVSSFIRSPPVFEYSDTQLLEGSTFYFNDLFEAKSLESQGGKKKKHLTLRRNPRLHHTKQTFRQGSEPLRRTKHTLRNNNTQIKSQRQHKQHRGGRNKNRRKRRVHTPKQPIRNTSQEIQQRRSQTTKNVSQEIQQRLSQTPKNVSQVVPQRRRLTPRNVSQVVPQRRRLTPRNVSQVVQQRLRLTPRNVSQAGGRKKVNTPKQKGGLKRKSRVNQQGGVIQKKSINQTKQLKRKSRNNQQGGQSVAKKQRLKKQTPRRK